MKLNEACMKKKRARGYFKLETYFDRYGQPFTSPRFIENVMSEKCRSDQDIWRTGACKGCKQIQDFDYFRERGLV